MGNERVKEGFGGKGVLGILNFPPVAKGSGNVACTFGRTHHVSLHPSLNVINLILLNQYMNPT